MIKNLRGEGMGHYKMIILQPAHSMMMFAAMNREKHCDQPLGGSLLAWEASGGPLAGTQRRIHPLPRAAAPIGAHEGDDAEEGGHAEAGEPREEDEEDEPRRAGGEGAQPVHQRGVEDRGQERRGGRGRDRGPGGPPVTLWLGGVPLPVGGCCVRP